MLMVIVCLKVIDDPETPLSLFQIDHTSGRPVLPIGVPPVVSPFDENALEAALRIKDRYNCMITVLSLGKTLPQAILRKCLAAGADRAIRLEDDGFENLDPYNTALALAHAIQRIGEYDLIFTGRQAADWDAGVVWAGIAEFLKLPSITLARNVEIHGGTVTVERVIAEGIETFEAEMPLLVTFSNEVGNLRGVSVPALVAAKKREIRKWAPSDIGFEPTGSIELTDLHTPEFGDRECRFIEGNGPAERGRNLARKLLEVGVIS